MGIIEDFSESLSETISKQLNYNEDQKEVIAYGAFALLHVLWSYSLIILVGYLTGLFIPVVILLVVSAVLRKFSGGAHCTSPGRCAVASILSLIPLGLFV